jgi:lipopolysaccharide export system permease protein
MIAPLAISVVFFTFVFLMAEMLKITDLVVNYGVGLLTVIKMLIYSTPYFLVFVIPMAVMIAVLLAFLRSSADNEIMALKTGGLNTYRLLPPVLLLCFIGFALTLMMSIYGMPWGRKAIRELSVKILSSKLDIGLKERTFNDSFSGVMLYVNKVDTKNNFLVDVFIEDKRNEDIASTVIAPRGRLFSKPGALIFHMKLYDGIINQVGMDNKTANTIKFNTYDLTLDLKKAALDLGSSRRRKELSLTELRRYLQRVAQKDERYYKALIEFHKKFSIPFACFALGILAFPLGLESKSAKRSTGLILGLVFFLIYYLLLSAGTVWSEAGTFPPVIGMWLPNFVSIGLGVFLLFRAARDKPIPIGILLPFFRRLGARFAGKNSS